MKLASSLVLAFALVIALVGFAPATLAASASASASAPAPAPKPAGDMSLLVDFVEFGRTDRALSRTLAMVDLLNLTDQTLDVIVGGGGTTLKPKERLIARIAGGEQLVTVKSRLPGVEPIEGRLSVEAGVHYELAFGYGEARGPLPEGEIALPGVDGPGAAGGSDIAPRPAGALPAAAPAAAPKTERRTKGGRVDVGRRR